MLRHGCTLKPLIKQCRLDKKKPGLQHYYSTHPRPIPAPLKACAADLCATRQGRTRGKAGTRPFQNACVKTRGDTYSRDIRGYPSSCQPGVCDATALGGHCHREAAYPGALFRQASRSIFGSPYYEYHITGGL